MEEDILAQAIQIVKDYQNRVGDVRSTPRLLSRESGRLRVQGNIEILRVYRNDQSTALLRLFVHCLISIPGERIRLVAYGHHAEEILELSPSTAVLVHATLIKGEWCVRNLSPMKCA